MVGCEGVSVLQGAVLSTSDRGGIRIQYSKNPFGKKRDASGNWISTNENGSFGGGTPQDPPAPGGLTVHVVLFLQQSTSPCLHEETRSASQHPAHDEHLASQGCRSGQVP